MSVCSSPAHLYCFTTGFQVSSYLPDMYACDSCHKQVLVGFLPRRSRNHICPTSGASRDKTTLFMCCVQVGSAPFSPSIHLQAIVITATNLPSVIKLIPLLPLLLDLYSFLQSVDFFATLYKLASYSCVLL